MTLTTSELTRMRADVTALLPDTCNILSVTNTPDSMGGVSQAWGTATASVACRLDRPIVGRFAGGQANIAAALQEAGGYILTLPHGTAITTGNRVQVGGNTYDVQVVNTDQSYKLSVRCIVELV